MACPMRFGPHLCSHPPGRADPRDPLKVEMGSRRKRVTQTGSKRAARRPKPAKLAVNATLRTYVQDRLAGVVVAPGGAAVAGPAVPWKGRRHGRRQNRRWAAAWSLQQIAQRLRLDFPGDETMRISHEAIYQALYIQGRGALRRELTACLRTRRALRVPRARTRGRGKSFVTPEVLISERPAEANERAVPAKPRSGLRGVTGRGTSYSASTVRPSAPLSSARCQQNRGAVCAGSQCCCTCRRWRVTARGSGRRTAPRSPGMAPKRCATRLCARSRACQSSCAVH